jgi:hypothetical protein
MRIDELLTEAEGLVSNDIPATQMGCVIHLLVEELKRAHGIRTGSTHYEGCYQSGYRHYACAMYRLEQVEAENALLRVQLEGTRAIIGLLVPLAQSAATLGGRQDLIAQIEGAIAEVEAPKDTIGAGN